MRHTITCTAELDDTTVEEAWAVWSDVESYPRWDERTAVNELDGPFVAGATGRFEQSDGRSGTYTVTAVDPGRSWTSESGLPLGRLVIDHEIERGSAGAVHLTKRYTAHGPMAVAFRLFFVRGIRAELPGSFAALGQEIVRRRTAHVR